MSSPFSCTRQENIQFGVKFTEPSPPAVEKILNSCCTWFFSLCGSDPVLLIIVSVCSATQDQVHRGLAVAFIQRSNRRHHERWTRTNTRGPRPMRGGWMWLRVPVQDMTPAAARHERPDGSHLSEALLGLSLQLWSPSGTHVYLISKGAFEGWGEMTSSGLLWNQGTVKSVDFKTPSVIRGKLNRLDSTPPLFHVDRRSQGFETPTFRLVDDPFHLLTHSHRTDQSWSEMLTLASQGTGLQSRPLTSGVVDIGKRKSVGSSCKDKLVTITVVGWGRN